MLAGVHYPMVANWWYGDWENGCPVAIPSGNYKEG